MGTRDVVREAKLEKYYEKKNKFISVMYIQALRIEKRHFYKFIQT